MWIHIAKRLDDQSYECLCENGRQVPEQRLCRRGEFNSFDVLVRAQYQMTREDLSKHRIYHCEERKMRCATCKALVPYHLDLVSPPSVHRLL